MNLHKAKGLEAAVVFLANPTGGAHFGAGRHIVRDGDTPRGWFVVERPEKDGKWRGPQVLARPADWEVHAAAEQMFLDAEETRLLYVAATRARDLRVVGRYARNGNGRPWGALDPFLSAATELTIPEEVGVPRPKNVDVSGCAGKGCRGAMRGARTRARTVLVDDLSHGRSAPHRQDDAR